MPVLLHTLKPRHKLREAVKRRRILSLLLDRQQSEGASCWHNIRVFSASSGHQVSDTRPNQAPSLHWLNLLQHQPRSLAVLCAEQDAKAELDRDCTPTVTLLTGDATGGFAPSSHCLADMVLHTYSETFGCVLLMQMAVAAAVRFMRHS